MKEIKVKFEHQKLVFEIDGESYFLPSSKFLELLNAVEMRGIFRSLNPNIKFADLNQFDPAVLYSNLKDRGARSKEISVALNISESMLKEWLETTGRNFIEGIKKEIETSFNARYQKLNDSGIPSLIKMYHKK